MTANALVIGGEVLGIAIGGFILLLFGVALGIPHRSTKPSGAKGHREEHEEHETVSPDGYIDSFAGVIEEAGGSLTTVVRLAIPGVLLWWLIYMIINWMPRIYQGLAHSYGPLSPGG
jgi:hypothetical protein